METDTDTDTDTELASLSTRWVSLLSGDPREPELLVEIARRYGEAHRVYHGLRHLDALAQLYLDVERGPGWLHAPEVKAAILFHDAIYNPGRSDNEARSAELAREQLRGWALDLDRVDAMIRATRAHDQVDTSDDPDLAHFLDADMAIIGAETERYDAYAQAVRQEFAGIPAQLFDLGRRHFLSTQLARASLFHSPFFGQRYEQRARANLARELGA